jgi:hypothetical protein
VGKPTGQMTQMTQQGAEGGWWGMAGFLWSGREELRIADWGFAPGRRGQDIGNTCRGLGSVFMVVVRSPRGARSGIPSEVAQDFKVTSWTILKRHPRIRSLDLRPIVSSLRGIFLTVKHFLFLAALLLNLLPAPALEPFVDGVAAAVNDDVITFSQVQDLTRPLEGVINRDLTGDVRTKKIQEVRISALNDLIDRQLIIQEFKKMKGAIPAYVVEDRITALIREQFGGDRVVFRRTIL